MANSFLANQGTQSALLTDNTGGISGTLIPVMKISTDASGTFTTGNIWSGGVTGTINTGSIIMTSGTIAGGTITNLVSGTINSATVSGNLGTIGTLGLGTITGNLGTIGTLGLGTITGNLGTMGTLGTTFGMGTLANQGSLTNVGQIYNAGTLQAGTLGTVTNLGSVTNLGQIYNAGTLQNLNFGTIAISDGTTKANVMASGISNGTGAQNAQLMAGGFAELSGSVTAGTTDLIPSTDVSAYRFMALQLSNTWVGTINAQVSNDNITFQTLPLSAITVTNNWNATLNSNNIFTGYVPGRYLRIRMQAFTSGTAQATLELFSTPSTSQAITAQALQSGGWNVSGTLNAGTIGTVTNLAQVYNAGTLQGGTINLGTFQSDPLPVRAISTFGTHGTTGVSIFGTLAGGTGSGAGTEIFITSLSVSIPSTGGSQDVSVGWGSNGGTFHAGTGRLIRGNFPAGGGIQKEFDPAINSGTNAQLMCFQAGAGTVDIDVTYFITPSSL